MEVNSYIEHTILKADTSVKEIETICKEAIEHKFLGVCVPPYFVKNAKQFLKKTDIKIITVVGFPLGYNSTPAKVEESRKAIDEGANEIDMVINIAAVKAGDFHYVENDILSVTTLSQMKGAKVKLIIETCLLTDEEKIKVCQIAAKVHVDFVKTSTGFSTEGAKVSDIKLLRENLPSTIKLKASGGIKTNEQALSFIKAGANRLGTSSGVKIVSNS